MAILGVDGVATMINHGIYGYPILMFKHAPFQDLSDETRGVNMTPMGFRKINRLSGKKPTRYANCDRFPPKVHRLFHQNKQIQLSNCGPQYGRSDMDGR
jgi:hypothetical protein